MKQQKVKKDSAKKRAALERLYATLGLSEKVSWAQTAQDGQLWHAIKDCRACVAVGCNPEKYVAEADLYLKTLEDRRSARAALATPWSLSPQNTGTLVLKAALAVLVANTSESNPKAESNRQAQALAETELRRRLSPRDFERFMIGVYEEN